jgi:hypothetical protein
VLPIRAWFARTLYTIILMEATSPGGWFRRTCPGEPNPRHARENQGPPNGNNDIAVSLAQVIIVAARQACPNARSAGYKAYVVCEVRVSQARISSAITDHVPWPSMSLSLHVSLRGASLVKQAIHHRITMCTNIEFRMNPGAVAIAIVCLFQ